jgi:hypothetical protein
VTYSYQQKAIFGLGDPAPNAPKWFAAVEMIRLATDQAWLHKATKGIVNTGNTSAPGT